MKKNLHLIAFAMVAVLMMGTLASCSTAAKNPACLGCWAHVGGAAALNDVYPPTDTSIVSICDSLTLFDDNTFILVYSFCGDYGNAGAGWTNLNGANELYYGTYEIVSEDAEYEEKTIKVTSVTGSKGADYDTSSSDYESYDESLKVRIDRKMDLLNGFEFTLDNHGGISGEYMFVHSLLAGNT